MDIRTVHSYLATNLRGLAITAPAEMSIKKVWKYTPPSNVALAAADLPTVMLTYSLTEAQFLPNTVTAQDYDIHLQLFAAKAEPQGDVAADIASAFLDATLRFLSAHQRLGSTVQLIRGFRGASSSNGGETLTVLQWAGAPFIGLDLVIPITLLESMERG